MTIAILIQPFALLRLQKAATSQAPVADADMSERKKRRLEWWAKKKEQEGQSQKISSKELDSYSVET
jgi:hypothetical protein